MIVERHFLLKLFITCTVCTIAAISCENANDGQSNVPGKRNAKISKLKLPAGYKAEHLYSPTEHGQGSWVAMTFDDRNRLIVSDQYGSLYRLQLPPVGADTSKVKVQVERLDIRKEQNAGGDSAGSKVEIGFAQGLLWAYNSLYVMVNHKSDKEFDKASGLYRVQDTNNDDHFDKVTLLKSLQGDGEHGPHNMVLAPDKKSIYVVAGNVTRLPETDASRLPPVWKEDNLLPFIKDPTGGQESELLPPAGWIAKTDSTGTKWELISGGFRNCFDMAFNEDDELFTFDSDKEFDLGLPWYRPTRICHVTSGSEFGWRSGSGKWPPAYPDNLPPIINIGQGSPTNVMSGNHARFPEKHRRGLFTFDWSFGIIYHIELVPEGSSYKAKAEEFISGSPLPLTDGAIGPDGAMYFLTGGRKIESDLYRVYYGDNTLENGALAQKQSAEILLARKNRKQLEAFHEKPSAEALRIAWPYLKSEDRFLSYAARVAVEHQPVSQWEERALAEKDPVILSHAMMALARNGSKKVQGPILDALLAVNYEQFSEAQKFVFLRALELTLSRMGKPDEARRRRLITYLGNKYPAATNEYNRLLSKILVFVDDTEAVPKTLALIDKVKDDETEQKSATHSSDLIFRNPQYGMTIAGMLANIPPAQQIYLATVLSAANVGWTPPLREKYFRLFHHFLTRKGGNSYIGYVDAARKIALAQVPKNEFAHYNAISGDSLMAKPGTSVARKERPKGPGRDWTLDEAVQVVQSDPGKRDYNRGKMWFDASLCSSCHSMRGEGGSIGPDLTQLGTRFSAKDILESIIDPNKEISDQYAASTFYLKDGSSILGRLIRQDKDKYYVSQNPFAPSQLREILKTDVTSNKISEVSIMLPGLINRLSPEELKDLMAYLMEGGNKDRHLSQGKSK